METSPVVIESIVSLFLDVFQLPERVVPRVEVAHVLVVRAAVGVKLDVSDGSSM